ncbi:chemotaxis protein CheW [Geobacter sp. DSM 9736]|uniref:chemotaxis protein CheW n=1 Tax=Geobacter sp. DSM 9736 TaxID=1277350 RepID=UPI000B513C87|nr:chemotaxis protein CheW [Geobacter sp. DSM 9736]SNB44746.1 CheW protein [Geobacter sp. DSM 9736]
MKEFSGEDTGSIDWRAVHARLEEAAVRAGQEWLPDQEARRRILEKRARDLARPPERREPEETLHILDFLLGEHQYGIDIGYVREVHPLRDLVPLPCTPPFIAGIMNIRGMLLSLTDLEIFFGISGERRREGAGIIILSTGGMELGVLADRILGVRMLPRKALQEGAGSAGINSAYIKGMTEDRTAVLDVAAILADPRLIVNEEAG